MRYRSVQLLRAVAAVMVLLLHVTGFALGGAGVDLFFVLSGFIIATLAPRETPLRFLAKRAARIYPIYWLCQLPYLIHAAVTAQLSAKLAFTSITLISIGSVSQPALIPGWTLIFEIFFYVVAAVCIAMRDYRPALLAFIACFIVNDVSGNQLTGFLGHPLVLEFLAGALIAIVPRSRAAALAGLVPAGIIVTLVWSRDMPFGWLYAGSAEQLYRVFCWGLPAALIVYAALTFEERFAGRSWEPLVLLGNASYALYLTHSVVVSLNLWPPIAIGVAIAVGLATHLWVEKPLVAAATRRWVPRPVDPVPATASAAISA